MNKISAKNLKWCAAFAAAAVMVMSAAFAAVRADAQSKAPDGVHFHGNETITVRTSTGDEDLRVSSNGCSGTLSGPGIFIAVGDGCWMWSETTGVPRAMRVGIATDQISFERERNSYLIHDAATVKRARDLFAPLEATFAQQSMLGAQQRALGEKQRALGEQQREVKVSVPDMSAEFAKVEADAKRLATQGGTQSDLGDLQSELGDLQSRIGDLQSQAGDAQSKLGEQQSVLGDQQSRLGDRQSVLGGTSEAMAKDVLVKLQALLTQAIQNGVAQTQ
jgi:hypothetical protein